MSNDPYPAMKAIAAAAIQKHPYSPKLDNDRMTASNIQQTDATLALICQFHSRENALKMTQKVKKNCHIENMLYSLDVNQL